mgnify:CR=1 FL=1
MSLEDMFILYMDLQTEASCESQRKLKALEAKLAMTEATLEEVLAENEELKARLG